MKGDFVFDKTMRDWHKRKKYLHEHYRHLDGVRFRPTGEPPRTVQTPSGPLVFTNSTRVQGLKCLVNEAPSNAAVGNAIDELLTLRYSDEPTTGTAECGRFRVRQRAFGMRHPATGEQKTPAELEAEDQVWKDYQHQLRRWLPDLRGDAIEDEASRTGFGRHGMVLGLHAAVGRAPELCDDPAHRHSRLGISHLGELLEMPDPEEISAVADMLHLATQALPAPSQVARSVVQPRCGHGSADLLLDGTLVEVKSRRGTQADSVLTGDTARQLLGYVLSVPPELEKEQPVTRAGW
ncbi:hypothetical protein [Brachybacterium sp. AOP29-B2-41]